ncbi:MAG: hypothetical protein KDA75_21605, partial [Planctomycetaceae bacterium]|nr:hypothetical protein [Planctomycetaceae bacterium]
GALDAGFTGAVGGQVEDFTFGPDGHIYAADASNARIVRVNTTTGALMGAFVTSSSGGLSYPAGLAFGPDGRLYVADQGANAIRVYSGTDGTYLGDYVASGYGGLDSPAYITFAADQQVTVQATPVVTQTLPGAQSSAEDTSVTFSTANGNAITVDDGTASTTALLQVAINVPSGTLALSTTAGLSFVGGANGTGGMVVWGTEAAINTALDGLVYTPAANFDGTVNLSVTTSLGNGLQGNYEFELAGTPGLDTSIGVLQNGSLNGTGTAPGPAVVVDGDRGNVLQLDGADDSIEITGRFGDPANVTLAAWVKFSTTDTFGGEVISLGNGVVLRVDDITGETSGLFWDGATFQRIASNISLADGMWHHVAFAFDDVANTQTLYIDGISVAAGTFTQSISYSTGFANTRIGAHPNDGDPNFHFDGRIDEARIYTRALSATEIAAIAADSHTASGVVPITVTGVNDQPVFTNLNGSPGYTEGGTAVVLDADVTIFDVELSVADDFTGATLTLARNGGANTEDQLAFDGVTVTTSGSNVSVSGVQIGTFSFTGGQLQVIF